jgi:serine/threonine protein kinase
MKEIKLENKVFEKIKDIDISKGNNIIGEIDICKDLDHPNIIQFYTAFLEKEKKSAYLILELVEGINLAEYIFNLKEKNMYPKERDILRILLDIICGLKYLHEEKKVLYRDVNPHNIMLDNNFNVKLCDFGLAVKKGNNFEHSNSTGFAGSILYSSPESVKNQECTEKSDIWSLGCVIYETLTLTPAFNGDNPLTVAKNIVELNYKKLNENDFENKVSK